MAKPAVAAQQQEQNVKFMTVAEFKAAIGATKLEILKSPKTDKLFMSADGNRNFKVQGDINPQEDMRVLIPEDDIDQACLVNVSGGAEAIFTL